MGFTSPWHWIIVAIVLLILFGGRGKIPSLMGDVAKGIKSFKSNMKDQKDEDTADAKKIEAENAPAASAMQDEQTTAKS
jgi:sec-independent protein translocase protein TatA